jgi:2-isopropylmalate synthase
MNKHPDVRLYDTTLRDGTQGEGVNFSSLDKIRIAQQLDSFGMHYIEGGWPGSNPKDVSFFERAADLEWKNARVAASNSSAVFAPPSLLIFLATALAAACAAA